MNNEKCNGLFLKETMTSNDVVPPLVAEFDIINNWSLGNYNQGTNYCNRYINNILGIEKRTKVLLALLMESD